MCREHMTDTIPISLASEAIVCNVVRKLHPIFILGCDAKHFDVSLIADKAGGGAFFDQSVALRVLISESAIARKIISLAMRRWNLSFRNG
jgi:hypothetical protein